MRRREVNCQGGLQSQANLNKLHRIVRLRRQGGSPLVALLMFRNVLIALQYSLRLLVS